jgi:hypothetical protein
MFVRFDIRVSKPSFRGAGLMAASPESIFANGGYGFRLSPRCGSAGMMGLYTQPLAAATGPKMPAYSAASRA